MWASLNTRGGRSHAVPGNRRFILARGDGGKCDHFPLRRGSTATTPGALPASPSDLILRQADVPNALTVPRIGHVQATVFRLDHRRIRVLPDPILQHHSVPPG